MVRVATPSATVSINWSVILALLVPAASCELRGRKYSEYAPACDRALPGRARIHRGSASLAHADKTVVPHSGQHDLGGYQAWFVFRGAPQDAPKGYPPSEDHAGVSPHWQFAVRQPTMTWNMESRTAWKPGSGSGPGGPFHSATARA